MAPPLWEEAEPPPPPPPPPGRQQKQRPPEHDDDADDDDGTPTASLCADLRRSLALIHEERHLVAYDLYRDVLRRVDAATTTAPTRRRAPFHAFHSPLRRRRRQQQGGSPAAAAGVATGDRDGSGMDRMQDYRNAKVLLERKEEEFTTLEVSGAAKHT